MSTSSNVSGFQSQASTVYKGKPGRPQQDPYPPVQTSDPSTAHSVSFEWHTYTPDNQCPTYKSTRKGRKKRTRSPSPDGPALVLASVGGAPLGGNQMRREGDTTTGIVESNTAKQWKNSGDSAWTASSGGPIVVHGITYIPAQSAYAPGMRPKHLQDPWDQTHRSTELPDNVTQQLLELSQQPLN